MTCSRYGWNNTGSLVALECVCSKHIQGSQNTMQQTHAVFGESAHYGSEPFNLYGTNLTANLAFIVPDS